MVGRVSFSWLKALYLMNDDINDCHAIAQANEGVSCSLSRHGTVLRV